MGGPGSGGANKKPTALRLLEGDRSHRPLNKAEPKPAILAEFPEPPDNLGEHGREQWNTLGPILHRLGLLTVVDLLIFEQVCSAYEQYRIADAEWAADGRIVNITDKVGRPAVHPALAAMKNARADMLAISKRFGFTPSDRASIKGPELSDAEETRLDTPARVGRSRTS